MPISTGANVPQVTVEDIEAARQAIIAKTGRPSKYSAELAADILVRLESGESLTSICRGEGMPVISTIYDWRGKFAPFAESYARAMKNAATSYGQGGVDLLDELEKPKFDKSGELIPLTMTTIRLAEMRAKYRKELAKDYDKETFGNQVQVNQQVTIETMEQRVQRLTGAPLALEAQWSHVVEIED